MRNPRGLKDATRLLERREKVVQITPKELEQQECVTERIDQQIDHVAVPKGIVELWDHKSVSVRQLQEEKNHESCADFQSACLNELMLTPRDQQTVTKITSQERILQPMQS